MGWLIKADGSIGEKYTVVPGVYDVLEKDESGNFLPTAGQYENEDEEVGTVVGVGENYERYVEVGSEGTILLIKDRKYMDLPGQMSLFENTDIAPEKGIEIETGFKGPGNGEALEYSPWSPLSNPE